MEIEELKKNITNARKQLAIMMNADDCVRIEAGMKEASEFLTAYIYLRKYLDAAVEILEREERGSIEK